MNQAASTLRLGKELIDANSFYDQLAAKRGDSAELIAKVEENRDAGSDLSADR